MTTDLLRQLAELDAKATPGPWSELEHSWQETGLYAGHRRLAGFSIGEDEEDAEYQSTHETSLIVALRNNLPTIMKALSVLAAVEKEKRNDDETVAMTRDEIAAMQFLKSAAELLEAAKGKR
jgi:hypothetical protein